MINYKTEWYEKTKPNYLEFDEGIKEFWKMKYNDRWAIVTSLLNKEFFSSLKVLDIGCGMGRALSWFQTFGADCVGVEPSNYAASIARSRGITVINDNFEDATCGDEYDIVHIEQVLSHIPSYKKTLDKAFSLLKNDGLIIVEEPNDNNPLQKILEAEHGKYWVSADHCNYFNYSLLADALDRSGFLVAKTSCTYPMELFELAGDHYIGNEDLGKVVHQKRYELESNMTFTLRQQIHEGFAKMGIGRDIVLFAIKKGVLK